MKARHLFFTIISLIIILGLGTVLFFLFTYKPNFQMPPMPTPTVTVARPVVQPVTNYYEFTGTTVAVEEVDIRARVQGYLEKIHFVEGSEIQKGDLLFQIERDLYQAVRNQAQANLKANQAELARAQLDLNRVEEAIKTNAVSQQEVSTRRAQRDQAEAAVMAAQASLEQAELNFSYTQIRSPIDGRISRKFVDVGNLVGHGEQTLLATIVKLQPMYVHFYISENLLLERMGDQPLARPAQQEFFVAREGETDYSHKGVLNYLDNKVDSGTGTILMRGELANADRLFLPGMFVRVKIPVGTNPEALLVQDRAINTDIGGKFVLLVDADGMVRRQPVQMGRSLGEMRVITSGLTASDTYVLRGVQAARPGMKVIPQTQGQGETSPSEAAQNTTVTDRSQE
ncbi:MAG: efflux RND transporter periplasmic adaptor subunit [Sedimentisphaerales bacterium]|nr:efflux RND transporter periplasmic adaptor subunit [Sedimentisphaerales bacterium]